MTKIYVAEKYDGHTHDFHPIKDGHRTTLTGAMNVAKLACPVVMKWEQYTNGRGERCWRGQELSEPVRDARGYLPSILPSDFMVREVELIEDAPEPEPCILCGGAKVAPVVEIDGATLSVREIACPLCHCEEVDHGNQG